MSVLAEIADMLVRHAEKRIAPPPLHLLTSSSSSLLTPVSSGGIVAAAMRTPSSCSRESLPLPPCANNHLTDCLECRAACDDCKDSQDDLEGKEKVSIRDTEL